MDRKFTKKEQEQLAHGLAHGALREVEQYCQGMESERTAERGQSVVIRDARGCCPKTHRRRGRSRPSI